MAGKKFLNLNNGYTMPILGLGTWNCKGDEGEQALEEALAAGYRHFDTAFIYDTEKLVGKVINRWITAGKLKREDIFLTTKLHGHCLRPDKVEHYMKESLKNLQFDYVDLYLIHYPIGLDHDKFIQGKVVLDPNLDLIACWKKMEEQVDAKRTRSIGISNFNENQIQRILNIARIKPANLQIEHHLYMQQRELVDFCKKNNISIAAYCPLGNPSYNTFLLSIGQKPKELPNILGNTTVKSIADKHKKSPAQVALKHIVQRGISAIPKSTNPSRIKENINVFDFVLDEDDMASLDALEVGPAARMSDFLIFEGVEDYPEYPFKVNKT